MDNPGWKAQRKADKESAAFNNPRRDQTGHFHPVEEVAPLNGFVGGFIPPPPPPKDHKNGHAYDPKHAPSQISTLASRTSRTSRTSESTSRLAHMSPVERSQAFRVNMMQPHLQLMVGPLLRYDTVDAGGIWNGFALVVTSDAGSVYEPYPVFSLKWDPDAHAMQRRQAFQSGSSFPLGPHPADPHSSNLPSPNKADGEGFPGPNAQYRQISGQELWVYAGAAGSHTFWRFAIQIPLSAQQMKIGYQLNNGQELSFWVPGRNENMRFAAHSCNGFSAGVNPDDFRGPGFKSGYDPVWTDLLAKHAEKPFHVLVGGGDQLYCDSLMREPEMQEWADLTVEDRKTRPLTEEVAYAIDRFFFNHYCHCFRTGAFARANSSIPMANMTDDHDLIDGFGSYPDDLQLSPVFNAIGARGYFFYLLFQCFINVELDGLDDKKHCNQSLIIGGPGPYVPFPSHSFLTYLGPQTYLLLLDTRAERKKTQVCSPEEYQKVFERLKYLPVNVEHLVVVLGVPIAYPRLVFLEAALASKYNPLLYMAKAGTMGLGGFINKFNAEAELLDDLNDHWTAKSHKHERNWFIQQLQHFAKMKRVRVSFLSGDVHCAAVGVLKTLAKGKKSALAPAVDHRYMLNVVSSAIVNTPPPKGVITMVSQLATKNHKTMHALDTDETMIPIFATETDGSPRKQKYIMGRRNWCCVDWDGTTGSLKFDLRVEMQKGGGVTVGYAVSTPPPRWSTN